MSVDGATVCQVCGRLPCVEVTIRRHVGMIFMQRFYKVQPTLCREDGLQLWRKWTGLTLLQGWWGYISFFANIFAVLMNVVAFAKLLRLGPPVGVARNLPFEGPLGQGWE